MEDFDLFIDDEDEDDNLLEDNVDEIELLAFLNEYYLIYPEKIPQKEWQMYVLSHLHRVESTFDPI